MKINAEYVLWVSFSLNPSFSPRRRRYEPDATISTIPLFQSRDLEALDRLWAKRTNLGDRATVLLTAANIVSFIYVQNCFIISKYYIGASLFASPMGLTKTMAAKNTVILSEA